MSLTHRPYQSAADLPFLLDWLGRHAHSAYMHPGDLVWWLRQNEVVDPARALDLYFSGAGDLAGFVFSDPPTWAVLQGRDDLAPDDWQQIIEVAENKAGEPVTFNAYTGEMTGARVQALRRAGYVPASTDRLARLYRVPGPADPAAAPLPAGFRFTDMGRADVSEADRVDLHRAVWHPSRVTVDAYRTLRAAPNYLPELDVVIVGPAGEPAAYALGWFDEVSRAGLLEPVGTLAEFRRRGLGRQLVREMTRRLAGLGAEGVTIGTRESNGAAMGLYQSAGYHVTGYWVDYRRTSLT